MISSGGVYGAEKMLLGLVQALKRLGCQCVLGVFANGHRPDGHLADLARSEDLCVEKIRCSGKADWGAVSRIQRCINANGIDIVHTHGYKADVYGYAAARRSQTALVATSHSHTPTIPLLRAWARIDQMALRRFDRIVAVSDEIAALLRRSGASPDAVTTIDNGVDLAPFANARATLKAEFRLSDRKVIGTVARLVEQKGLKYLLRCVRPIVESHPSAIFVIVGDGPQRAELTQLARQLGLKDSVIFTGPRDDMPGVYASLDIFVLPSVDEGMPIALLEALASRLPVVATHVAAVPKLVVDQETGLLVEPRDVAALNQAIRSLLVDRDLCDRLARNGYDRVLQHYSAAAMAEEYLKVYQQVMDSRLVVPKRRMGSA